MSIKKLLFAFTLATLFFHVTGLQAQENGEVPQEVLAGQNIFKAKCATCHVWGGKLIGPPMEGVLERWEEAGEYQGVSSTEWLRRWIRNWQDPVDAGYPYAEQMESYDASAMQVFGPTLTDGDLDNLMAYLAYGPVEEKKDDGGDQVAQAPGAGGDNTTLKWLFIILVGLLIVITLILARVSTVLGRLSKEKAGEEIPEAVPFYKNKRFVGAIALGVLIFVGYNVVDGAINLGRQKGYMPEQPIAFSHEIHAGINQVDCQYCHNSASKSKHSTIPSTNVCMNCHKGINGDGADLEGLKFGKNGRKEISKIYAAIGFNPNNRQYIEDYQEWPREKVDSLYREWIMADPHVEHTDAEVDEVVAMAQKPVEWVRIHNLPDHVYFNHSQHVNVAKLECQECHGPVETMKELYQFAPLSMGWCLSCHRNEEVNFAGNDYYKIYEEYHKEVTGKGEAFTVEKIGGTECQKCHY